jgi:hypothetical protein
MSVMLISACSAPRPMALAESGPTAITVAGQGYMADLQPVDDGGRILAITRDGAPFSHADGLPAKRAAEAFCGARKSRLNPAAFGHFSSGSWQFKGGCA